MFKHPHRQLLFTAEPILKHSRQGGVFVLTISEQEAF